MTINVTTIVSICQRFSICRFLFFIIWLAWCKPLSFLASWLFLYRLRGLFCWNWGFSFSFSSRSRFDLAITIQVLLFSSWLLHSNRGNSICKCRIIYKYARCRFYFHEWLNVSLHFLFYYMQKILITLINSWKIIINNLNNKIKLGKLAIRAWSWLK